LSTFPNDQNKQGRFEVDSPSCCRKHQYWAPATGNAKNLRFVFVCLVTVRHRYLATRPEASRKPDAGPEKNCTNELPSLRHRLLFARVQFHMMPGKRVCKCYATVGCSERYNLGHFKTTRNHAEPAESTISAAHRLSKLFRRTFAINLFDRFRTRIASTCTRLFGRVAASDSFRFAVHPLSFVLCRGLFVKDVGIPVSVPS
jgi:hypothetical protein